MKIHGQVRAVVLLLVSVCPLLLVAMPALSGTNQWSTTGPQSALVQAVAVSPNFATSADVFAGMGSAGIYRSTDGGSSWSHSSAVTGDIRAIAPSTDYGNDPVVFAGTNTAGLLKSSDRGVTWASANSGVTADTAIYALAVSPNYQSDNTVFAGAYGAGGLSVGGGVYKSTNGGTSWSLINSGLTRTNVYSVAVAPNYTVSTDVFAGTNSGYVYKSTNGGTSWTGVNVGSGTSVRSIAVSPNYENDRTLFAGTYGGGVFKSTNGGSTWAGVDLAGQTNKFTYAVRLSPGYPSDPTVIAATMGGIFRSTAAPGSESWSLVNTGLTNGIVYSLAFSPAFGSDQTVFAGTYGGGVAKSVNSATSWTPTNDGIIETLIQGLALSPNYASDSKVFAGAYMGGFFRSSNGGTTFSQLNNMLGTDVRALAASPNYSVDSTIFSASSGGVYRTTDDAAVWTQLTSGLTNTNVKSVAVSPGYASDQRLFAGTSNGLFHSSNKGATWTKVTSGPTTALVYSIAVSPGFVTDDTLFAATDLGVYRSTDDASTWILCTTGLSNLSDRSVALSPNFVSDRTVYVATNNGGVFKSTSACANWTQINSGLTSLDLRAVALSPAFATDSTLFAASVTGGVFQSINGGSSWVPINSGLSNMAITSLAVPANFSSQKTVFAGSYGGGVFSLTDVAPVTTLTTSPAAPDGTNSWFATNPTITLTRSETGSTYYQWGSTADGGWSTYSTPFRPQEGSHTLYYRSLDLTGNTEDVQSSLVKVDTGRPRAPALSGTRIGSTQIDLSWPATEDTSGGSGIAGYRLYDSDSMSLIATTTPDTSYSHTGLTPDTVFRYVVKSFDNAGNLSGPSRIVAISTAGGGDTTAPERPSLSGFAASATQIDLKWGAVADNVGVAGYKIYNGDDSTLLQTVTSGLSHSFTGLTPDTFHSYYVQAYDAAGNQSASSNLVRLNPGAGGTTPADYEIAPVTVNPISTVSVSFDDVTSDGTTTAITSDVYIEPPSGYRFGGNQVEITTTASYTGPITLAISYDPGAIEGNEEDLRLFHYEGGVWVDVTTYVDTDANIIYGETTSLSPFATGFPEGDPEGETLVSTGLSPLWLILGLLLLAAGVHLSRSGLGATRRIG